MQAPVVVKPIPAQVINERAAYGPFNLKEFIQAPDGSRLNFSAELKTGAALPKGMICTEDGTLTGIPAKGTSGIYEVIVTALNETGGVQAEFVMTIKPSFATEGVDDYFDKLKSQIWEALEQNLPVPDLGELLERPITQLEINYILERWAVLIIWDAFNLEAPGAKKLLELEGASEHYHVYDRGSCIIAAPKDLYSFQRTLQDALVTAQAVAREVYRRNWTVEMAGYFKLTRAAWVEFQHLADKHGKKLEIINFSPSSEDIKIYASQAIDEMEQRRGPEPTD